MVFEKFRQVGDTLTDKPQGTGLGLPDLPPDRQSFRRAALGRESTSGSGSTFSFTLPLAAALRRWPRCRLSRGASMAKRILIADDEPNIVISLEFLLTQAGFEVASRGQRRGDLAGCSPSAARSAAARRHAAAQERLRGLPDASARIRRSPRMKIVMLTAKGRDTEVAKGLALGADAYVTKPFGTRELVATVRTLAGEMQNCTERGFDSDRS